MAILRFGKRMKRASLGLFLLGIVFAGLSTTGIATANNYEVALNKGTETYVVNQYDEDRWEKTIDEESEPDDWFGGDSDIIGAKSKITIRSIGDYKWDAFEVLMSIFDVLDSISKKERPFFRENLEEDTINDEYSDKYQVWEALCSKWDFEADDFEEEPDDSEAIIPIFKDPKDLSEILEFYNTWAEDINSIMIMLELEPFPILDGDEFLWNLALSGKLIVARPIKEYLKTLVDDLDCNDVEVKGTTLIFEREDDDKYIAEVTFSDQGTQSGFTVKDDDNIIYEIILDNTTTIILISIGVSISAIAGIVIIFIFIKKRKKY